MSPWQGCITGYQRSVFIDFNHFAEDRREGRSVPSRGVPTHGRLGFDCPALGLKGSFVSSPLRRQAHLGLGLGATAPASHSDRTNPPSPYTRLTRIGDGGLSTSRVASGRHRAELSCHQSLTVTHEKRGSCCYGRADPRFLSFSRSKEYLQTSARMANDIGGCA